MRRAVRSGWLAIRSIRHRPGLYGRSIVATAIVVAAAMAPATFARSVRGALVDDLLVQAGGRELIAQYTASGSTQALRSDPEVDAVWFEPVTVTSSGARIDAAIVLYEKPPHAMPGLVRGDKPQQPGQAAITSEMAAALSIGVDSLLETRVGRLQVSGIYVSPARPQVTEAVAVVDTAALPDRPPDAYFIGRAAFERFSGELSIQSLAGHLEENPYISRARQIAAAAAGAGPAIMLLMVAALLAVLVAWGRALGREISGLRAAGMSGRQVDRVFRIAAGVFLISGAVLGVATLVALFSTAGRALASMVAQEWLHVRHAWWSGLGFAAMAVAAIVVADTTRAWQPHRTRNPLRAPGNGFATVVVPLVVGAGCLAWVGTRSGPRTVGIAIIAMLGTILVLVALLPAIALASSRLVRGGTRAVIRALDAGRAPIVLVATILLGMGSFAAALVHVERTTLAIRDSNAIPARALVLETVRPADAAKLRSGYRRVTGREAIEFRRPDETAAMIRLVPGSAEQCVASASTIDAALDRCGDSDGLYMASVAAESIGLDFDDTTWKISPRLDDGSGSVAVVSIDPTTGAIMSVDSVSPVAASSWFGEYSAGALAPPGVLESDPATAMSYVVLPGFADLPPDQQAQVQELIFRHAGYSLVFFKEAEDYGMLSLEYGIVAVVGALYVSAFMFWGTAGPRSLPELSALLAITRPTRMWQNRVAATWLIPAVVVPIAAGLVGLAAARVLTGIRIEGAAPLMGAFVATGCASGIVAGYHSLRTLGRPR